MWLCAINAGQKRSKTAEKLNDKKQPDGSEIAVLLRIQEKNMKKSYEAELPCGYTEKFTIDAKSKKTAIIMNIACLLITAAIIAVAYIIIKPTAFFGNYSFARNIIFIAAIFLYIILHELVHGIAYKLTTGRKLTFGLTISVAYCGVPDIYVYRKTALIALLAPFVVFIPVFLIPALLFTNAWDKLYCTILLAIHIGGCVGDLYDTLIYLFRFRSPDTLMRDTGPKQTFYTK